MAKSMSGQLPMFGPTTSEDSSSVTSSPALEDGVTRSDSPAGLILEPSGQGLAHVRHLVQQRGGEMSRRSFGLNGVGSWLSAALVWCLANRLSDAPGSIVSLLRWKTWTTGSGRRFSRLSASRKTISENGFTLWATPTATANQACPSMRKWPGCRGIEVTPEAWARRMGYPETWLRCLDSAMPSCLKSRRHSSKPT